MSPRKRERWPALGQSRIGGISDAIAGSSMIASHVPFRAAAAVALLHTLDAFAGAPTTPMSAELVAFVKELARPRSARSRLSRHSRAGDDAPGDRSGGDSQRGSWPGVRADLPGCQHVSGNAGSHWSSEHCLHPGRLEPGHSDAGGRHKLHDDLRRSEGTCRNGERRHHYRNAFLARFGELPAVHACPCTLVFRLGEGRR